MDRLLRTYTHVSQTEHWCDRCCTYIQPGQTYEGMVYASKRHGIVTLKMHIYPACDYPDDPIDESTLDTVVEESFKEAA